MLDQEKLESLLNRSLTAKEIANLDLYLDIAAEKLETLLCTKIAPVPVTDPPTTTTKKYIARKGYSTVFTDIYSAISSLKVDGIEATNYTKMWFSDQNATVFNSVVFDEMLDGQTIEITGTFGFATLPNDLSLLLAKLFDLNTKSQTSDGRVQSKQVEDFKITYNDITLDEQFYSDYATILSKYSQCNVGYILHGGCVHE